MEDNIDLNKNEGIKPSEFPVEENTIAETTIDKSNEKADKLKNETAPKEIESKAVTKLVNNKPTTSSEIKQKKELPIEKKPFDEFVNLHLIPKLTSEFKNRGFEIESITLEYTFRPIARDKCWVIKCEVKDICNFWISFEKDDISSSKSISLSKPNQEPSIIESFLIDEKRITLQLIISRVLQRLNGQKLIGVN